MKVWDRSLGHEACGKCGSRQVEGTPVQRVKIAGVTKALVRCQVCANEPVNFDQLERADVKAEAQIGGFSRFEFKGITREIFDAKMAAAGKDDDGPE